MCGNCSCDNGALKARLLAHIAKAGDSIQQIYAICDMTAELDLPWKPSYINKTPDELAQMYTGHFSEQIKTWLDGKESAQS